MRFVKMLLMVVIFSSVAIACSTNPSEVDEPVAHNPR